MAPRVKHVLHIGGGAEVVAESPQLGPQTDEGVARPLGGVAVDGFLPELVQELQPLAQVCWGEVGSGGERQLHVAPLDDAAAEHVFAAGSPIESRAKVGRAQLGVASLRVVNPVVVAQLARHRRLNLVGGSEDWQGVLVLHKAVEATSANVHVHHRTARRDVLVQVGHHLRRLGAQVEGFVGLPVEAAYEDVLFLDAAHVLGVALPNMALAAKRLHVLSGVAATQMPGDYMVQVEAFARELVATGGAGEVLGSEDGRLLGGLDVGPLGRAHQLLQGALRQDLGGFAAVCKVAQKVRLHPPAEQLTSFVVVGHCVDISAAISLLASKGHGESDDARGTAQAHSWAVLLLV